MKFIFLMSVFVSINVLAVEYKIFKKNSTFEVLISEVPLPEEMLLKSLPSGISNKLLAKLTLLEEKKELFVENINIKIIYDLWDEIFNFQIIKDHNLVKSERFKEKNQVLNQLKKISFEDFQIKEEKLSTLKLKFELILEPISNEKKSKIKKWISENKVNFPEAASKYEISKNSQSIKFNSDSSAIFNSMLDRELSSKSEEGEWNFVAEFENLKIGNKENEK